MDNDAELIFARSAEFIGKVTASTNAETTNSAAMNPATTNTATTNTEATP